MNPFLRANTNDCIDTKVKYSWEYITVTKPMSNIHKYKEMICIRWEQPFKMSIVRKQKRLQIWKSFFWNRYWNIYAKRIGNFSLTSFCFNWSRTLFLSEIVSFVIDFQKSRVLLANILNSLFILNKCIKLKGRNILEKSWLYTKYTVNNSLETRL